ncbi:MATE family efflux transporter [Tissierella carlieri]|uniref:MATE family efflux transporter n=1 Tax=Tissierella carlieri TaxID=689904 RepID=A0ABT1SDP4_9FIRM|nr:MATE family efflux transporter [Tissierella carlieri]MBU5311318.1 MATE family efflux transporter [Tissierella carlieri]MCQ4924612.1 MATE family efflux transporter [Tissierella carlieri]
MKKTLKDKRFFLAILTLVIPITLQNLISSSLNMVDNLMIGRLGESSIAAVGLVNQYFFIFMLCLTGINAGAGIFMSQFWGKKDISNIRKMLGLDMILSLIVSFLFFIPASLFPREIIKIFTKDTEVINLGVQYIRIISVTFVLTSITQAYSTTLRCIGIARLPMFGSLIGVLTNAFLNWVFIFGHFGFSAMGVAGAAIATSIARLVEMIFIIVCAYKSNSVIPRKLKNIIGFDHEFVKMYFKTSSSVIVNELVWSIGLSVYSIIYAKIGIREVASMQIASTINNLFMVFSIGLANAAAIMIGNKIGAGEEKIAINYAIKLGIFAPIVGLITGISLWIASPAVVGLFKINKDTLDITITVLKIMAFFAPLRFFNVLMIVGIFRGGGDTTYSMLVQLGTIWCFAIPAGFIAATYFKLPLEKVFFIISLEEVVKIFFEAKRLRSKKWIRNVVEELNSINIAA